MAIGTPLNRFLALYATMFAAFGVASPFLPGLLLQDGLTPGALGIVLAGGTAIRLLAGPAGGRLADRASRPSWVLAGFAAASALVALGYVPARGLPLLLLVSVAHAAVLAPLTPVADALALGSADGTPSGQATAGGSRPFSYGWVRGAGSAAFIAGTLASGQLVGRSGLGIVVWLNAALLALTAGAALLVPDRLGGNPQDREHTGSAPSGGKGAFASLLAIPVFTRLMLIVALIGGSHALHDGFEVIRWRSAGLSPTQCSVLWALSVASEVAVFVLLGGWLLRRLGPGGALALSAVAGIVRWSTAAQTAWFPAMALVEPLHGLTFALLHLACMQVIARAVPPPLAATAQAFYGTIAMGATSAAITLVSGPLYGHLGAAAFWPMAAMCALALPIVVKLRTSAASQLSGEVHTAASPVP